jgi:hypothetical protein
MSDEIDRRWRFRLHFASEKNGGVSECHALAFRVTFGGWRPCLDAEQLRLVGVKSSTTMPFHDGRH